MFTMLILGSACLIFLLMYANEIKRMLTMIAIFIVVYYVIMYIAKKKTVDKDSGDDY